MRKIELHTYEEWFLDFAENRLSAAERQQVLGFVAQHPELEEEFRMLNELPQIMPEPAEPLSKNTLLKKVHPHETIDGDNYVPFFIAALENDLDEKDRFMLDRFLEKNPSLQKEYDTIQKLRLVSSAELIYPDKSSLYREKEPARIVPFYWFAGMGAAATVLLFTGWFAFLRPKASPQEMAGNGLIRNGQVSLHLPERQSPNEIKTQPVPPIVIPSGNSTAQTPLRGVIAPVPVLESEFLFVETPEQVYPDLPEYTYWIDILPEEQLAEERPDVDIPRQSMLNANTTIIDAGASFLTRATKETWVLRIDRDDRGKTKNIRFSSPLFNINP
jgi:hypothetical protein